MVSIFPIMDNRNYKVADLTIVWGEGCALIHNLSNLRELDRNVIERAKPCKGMVARDSAARSIPSIGTSTASASFMFSRTLLIREMKDDALP
jgi:hypothetical protein